MPEHRQGRRANPRQGGVVNPDVDSVELGIQPQDAPIVNSMIRKVEESTGGSSPLNQGEAKNLVEILDKALSSKNLGKDSKDRFSKILRQVYRSHNILPTSYYAHNVVKGDPQSYGGFADVYRGQCAGQSVRINVFIKRAEDMNTELIKQRLCCEIVRWKYISHPNLLPFLGFSEEPSPYCIIGPWMPNGNIAEYTKRENGSNRLLLLAQSARGLDHLHSLDIVHGTLYPENILITEDGVARLADFGISSLATNPSIDNSGSMSVHNRKVCYMAPEQLEPSTFNRESANATKESDVHSFAMTAYEVLTGNRPYVDEKNSNRIINRILEGVRPPRPPQENAGPWLPDPIWEMIESCWVLDPLARSRIPKVLRTLPRPADDPGNPRIGELPSSHPPSPLESQGNNGTTQDSEKVSPKPRVQDTNKEGGGEASTPDVRTGPPLPPAPPTGGKPGKPEEQRGRGVAPPSGTGGMDNSPIPRPRRKKNFCCF